MRELEFTRPTRPKLLGVGAVEIGGAFLGVGLEADIRRCLHELGQVVAVRHGCFEVLDGALADGELIAVRQQTVQPFQHPQQDAGTLLGQLFDEEGIIHPRRVTIFHGRSGYIDLSK